MEFITDGGARTMFTSTAVNMGANAVALTGSAGPPREKQVIGPGPGPDGGFRAVLLKKRTSVRLIRAMIGQFVYIAMEPRYPTGPFGTNR